MDIIRFIMVTLGVVFLIKGGLLFTHSADSMLDRGAGFSTGNGTGMNQREVRQFESGLKWLVAGAVLLFLAAGAMG